jgi:phosphoenolpyruvate carboxylase
MARSLAQDVRLLGDTLGEVLRAHGGAELFDCVERMRLSAKTAREAGDAPRGREARRILELAAERMDPESAREVVRAFSVYFQLVNIAEDLERARILRRRESEGGPVPESLDAAVAELVESGAGPDEIRSALADLRLSFVFTAHPTEARRRTTERLLATARRALVDLDRRSLTPEDREAVDRRLRATVEALWEHAEHRERPPEVLEEVKAGLWYLRNVLLDVLPRLQRRLATAMGRVDPDLDPAELPVPVVFGSWMGGDRDGNPFVNDAVTERTLELHRRIVLDRYLLDLDGLVDDLAATARRLPDSPALDAAIAGAEAQVPEVVDAVRARNPDEPLRRLLSLMRERIDRTRFFKAGGYPDAAAFLSDLKVLRGVLRRANARALPDDALLDLVFRVRCFGFHLAALDVREDARVHREVVAEILGEPDYPSWPWARRREILATLTLPADRSGLSAEARRVLDCFATLKRLQTRFGPETLATYIASMTDDPADVLEVLRLASLHDLEGAIDIVPLLETRDALDRAGPLLEVLLADDAYRAQLRRRGDVQELLIGYSDSMKDAGILASRVAVLDAQVAAARACEAAGIRLRVFHGRGGTISRGGGPTHRAIRALPRPAFSGDVKITEQGETRSYHFGDPDLALRYLGRALGAALVVRWEARQDRGWRPSDETPLLRRLADESHRAYRRLTELPGFFTYFEAATPLAHIARLNVASRPSRRRAGHGLEDLRAIPWVFAWSQARHVITGWYGVGTALSAVAGEPGGEKALARLYETSPFFQDLLDGVQMVLAKGDLHIAERYAALCRDEAARERVFGAIREEHALTVERILGIIGQAALLDDDPVLQRSIRLRNPYVDPLSYLQVAGLRRAREGGEAAEAWDRLILGAVKGISAGLRNTG